MAKSFPGFSNRVMFSTAHGLASCIIEGFHSHCVKRARCGSPAASQLS